jgi:hypothetical protein
MKVNLVGGQGLTKPLKNCSRREKVRMKSGSKETVDICGIKWLRLKRESGFQRGDVIGYSFVC